MSWQDAILSVGQWVFLIALFPSILSDDKPALWTSIMTGSILAVFAVVYFSLSLWASAISVSIVSMGWFTMAIQKYLKDKK